MRQRIMLVTGDKGAATIFVAACERRKLVAECTASPSESRARWVDDESQLLGVVGDAATLTPQQKFELLQYHCEPGAPRLIMLDPPQIPDPRAPLETVTRLRWPLPAAFVDALKDIASLPMVFMTDPTLHITGMLQARLSSVGIQATLLDTPMGLIETLRRGPSAPEDAPAEGGGEGGLLSRLGLAKKEGSGSTPLPRAIESNSVVLLWKGDAFDAQVIQQRVAAELPETRFFLVTSAGAVHTAERALAQLRPAFLPRDLAEHTIDIFTGRPKADPMGLGRVLLVDNYKPKLIELTTSLMSEGYEVAACMKADEALDYVQNDRYHLAVIGTAISNPPTTSAELAKKMRAQDPDLRIILMVDHYVSGGLQGMSQAVEVGLDDSLLKPVEPSRLRFSISRALERRRLQLENTRLIEELKTTNDELEQLSGFQQKFFATVAHDVKNPLTAIRGYAELLSWKIKEADLAKCVTHIMSSSKTLEGLISDLVDYAAIESGKLRVNLEDMDLAQVVGEVQSRVNVAAEKRKIKLHVSLPEVLPKIQGDPLRVGQVIQNLCTNAIQYTPEGGDVFLKVQPAPSMVTISVRDTGIGISKEDLPRIFDRFFQAQNAQKMRRAGFGLGLKISQEIVKAHGGGMGVDSELGKGSVFYFTLPVPNAPAGAPAAAKGQPVASAPSTPSIHGPHTPMPGRV
ncbi:MAG: hybrid sensor histidine kinase/response regulator, partial [Elusimicrobia bacterium]|nr:hybrid sensor histidine kinase/response regulator [Elusimicrobiota bacterium]